MKRAVKWHGKGAWSLLAALAWAAAATAGLTALAHLYVALIVWVWELW